jgi:hypothetical protein
VWAQEVWGEVCGFRGEEWVGDVRLCGVVGCWMDCY